jgi:hypothetical protein
MPRCSMPGSTSGYNSATNSSRSIDDLARVHGDNSSATVRMTKKVVAALGSRDLKSGLPQGRDDLSPVIRGRRVTPL